MWKNIIITPKTSSLVLGYLIAGMMVNITLTAFISVLVHPITDIAFADGVRRSHVSPPFWVYTEYNRIGLTCLLSLPTITNAYTNGNNDDGTFGQFHEEISTPSWSYMKRHPDDLQKVKIPVDVAAGWPFRSFHSYYDGIEIIKNRQNAKVYGGINLDRKTPIMKIDYPRIIPYYPIWYGVLLNSVFYAIVLWSMRWIFIVLLRTKRIR